MKVTTTEPFKPKVNHSFPYLAVSPDDHAISIVLIISKHEAIFLTGNSTFKKDEVFYPDLNFWVRYQGIVTLEND